MYVSLLIPANRTIRKNWRLSYEINYNELSFEKKIAEGSFGIIYKGRWRGSVVAIKELKAEFLQEKSIIDFLSKINKMNVILWHHYVIQIFANLWGHALNYLIYVLYWNIVQIRI